MNETSQDACGPFLAGSYDAPPEIGLLRGVPEQGAAALRRHWRRWMRVLGPAGAAAAAAGVTAALLAGCASQAPSALAAVTSALAKTSSDSYSFSLDSTVHLAGLELHTDVVSGRFDPRHELGTELLVTREAQRPVRLQIRFIGAYVYTWVSPGSGLDAIAKPWNKALVPPAGAGAMPGNDLYGFVTDRPVSPAELSGVLQSAATVRDAGPASGPGWTGTRYTFTAHFPGWHESISATVEVDQQGRVRRLMTITTQGRATTDRDLMFGGFGAPVPVSAPPVSQAEYTRAPYWGFYF